MIYENHYSLNQRPFTIAPNPEFLYDCGQYQEALAVLQYGMLHRGGFVLLTGEVGTGKTTLCKHLLSHIPTDTEVALILHPQLDRLEMLQLICREFGIDFNEKDRELNLIERLTEFLLSVYSTGGHSVLIIDEAQHLDTQVLELIRLLTNLETNEDKLLQIILLGQPELKERLQQYNLRQLNQRFTARFHLNPLGFRQMKSYIAHRIKVAGSEKQIFTRAGLLMLHKLSGGIPRLANLIADRSLMGGYASNQESIGPWVVRKAAKEVIPATTSRPLLGMKIILPLFIALMLVINAIGDGVVFSSAKEKLKAITFLSGESVSANLMTCKLLNGCWQGRLPIELLKMHKESINPNKVLKEIAINTKGSWVAFSLSEFTKDYRHSGLISVRILRENTFGAGALKLGDYHDSIIWIRSVLERWGGDVTSSIQDDVSTWQVIEPSNGGSATIVQNESVYDQGLELRIKHFQKTYKLLVDGVIGSQTMVGLELLNDSIGGL